MIKKYFSRLPHAIRGLIYAFTHDFGFRSNAYLTTIIVIIASVMFQPLTESELLFIILAVVLIIITELQNSALEKTLDHLHPELHDNIKHSKDMASAAVFVAGLFLTIVLLVLGFGRF